MPVLKYYSQTTGQWESVSTAGPAGAPGSPGPTGPTGPTGSAAATEEVVIGTTEPVDLATDLWINTAGAVTASSGWGAFDNRYARSEPQVADNVDTIARSGYWIVDGTTGGTLPPDEDKQLVHTLVLGPNMQAQYAYDLSCDDADGVTTVHHRHKYGNNWSPWVNVTPKIVG